MIGLILSFLSFSRVGILLLVLHYLSEAMYHILQLLEFFDKEENNNKSKY